MPLLPKGKSTEMLIPLIMNLLIRLDGGWRRAQIYLLLSCCPCEGRVSGIVDVPNACCTLAIPIAIFDQARDTHGSMQRAPQLHIALWVEALLRISNRPAPELNVAKHASAPLPASWC